MANMRWQDVGNLVLGICIGASAWMLGIAEGHPVAAWNSLLVGVAIVVLAATDLDTPAQWEEWLLAALGLWLVAAPWVLGYAQLRGPMLANVVGGTLVFALAAWALAASGAFHRPHLPSH